MSKIKDKIEANLNKRFDIDEIVNKDKSTLRNEMDKYKTMMDRQYRQVPDIIGVTGLVLYIFMVFFADTAFGLALVIFMLIALKSIYNYWNIYHRRDQFKNKIYARRRKVYKLQYVIHAFLGLFGINHIVMGIEVIFTFIIPLTKKRVEKLWCDFDQKHYRDIVEESPFQRRTRLETEKENEYYYNVNKYLNENI